MTPPPDAQHATGVPDAANESALARGVREARVLICAGTGGVGKTTISAALGVAAARAGRRTLVLTIDPARRLADALGLEGLGTDAQAIDLAALADIDPGARATNPSGSLHARMLDPKPTFDGLVERLAPDAATRARILDNRLYQHLSEALAGSAEYAALEQVREAVESEDYDLVVVDTPPASHALDFLAAPQRLRTFLEGRFVKTLVRPAFSATRLSARILGAPLQRMLKLIERIAGGGFLDDLSEFLSAIALVSDGFQDGTARVERILVGEQTRFVLVGGARSGQEPGTLEFLEALRDLEVRLAGVVLNRIGPWTEAPDAPEASAWLEAAQTDPAPLERDRDRLEALFRVPDEKDRTDGQPAEEAARRVVEHVLEAARMRRDADATRRVLARRLAGEEAAIHVIAERTETVDRLRGLARIGEELVGGGTA